MSTKIEWTQETWNPTVGCSKVSAGCEECYAIKTAWIRQHNSKMKEKYAGVVQRTANGSLNWTGKINMHNLDFAKPLKKKKATTYFVDSMSDLFHENIPFEFIAEVYRVMVKCQQHTFQILTKRPERAEEFYMQHPEFEYRMNIHLGTSVEDNKALYERVPTLIRIKAYVRFLSCEPLIDRVTLAPFLKSEETCYKCGGIGKVSDSDPEMFGVVRQDQVCPKCNGKDSNMQGLSPIDWVIVGGKSGVKPRPMHPYWPDLLRKQCEEYHVPFFFKQWGEYYTKNVTPDGKPIFKKFFSYNHFLQTSEIIKKGEVCISWDGVICKTSQDFLTCQYPVYVMSKVGKKASGSLLNGKEYKQMPQVIPQ